ncbi:hypothetical protein CSC41_0175 [Pseudomonas aeruginosa]|nr:hypothetical protein CSB90_1235 [Pseudomonas aeruginosa]AWZ89093.1 hypothetical protein CSC41_0175 [Pseudomonas aeruginosa]
MWFAWQVERTGRHKVVVGAGRRRSCRMIKARQPRALPTHWKDTKQ